MNVLSLFDGMSGGQLALNRAGVKYDNYFASEIDRYARIVTYNNFPKTKFIGDVRRVRGNNLPKIDLLIGGSPCQGFSFAGKQLNFNDPRSKLFFEYVRLLRETKPKYFFLENVAMQKKYEAIITSYLGVQPIQINSRVVSPQNRIRLYWTNIPYTSIKPKKTRLQDILIKDHKQPVKELHKPVWRTKNYYGYLNSKKVNSQSNRIYYNTDAPCLVAKGSTPKILVGYNPIKYRELVPIEAERLQTVPDNYTNYVSNNQRLSMLGNGWTIDVIAHFFKGLL